MSDVDGVVFGAGSGVGFECVQHMLSKGQRVRAVVRSPQKYADKFPKDPNLTIAQGGADQSKCKGSPACVWHSKPVPV